MANLYVVDSQNESVILGYDWMDKEDIMIRARTKKVFKIPQEASNSAEVIETMIHEQFPKLIEESENQSLTTADYEHFIETGEARPVAMRDYRRSEFEDKHIQQEVEKMLKSGVIVPGTSDWCSPVVLIDKPDGSKRFCVDYRRLNQVTIKDKYPLPCISELLDKLHGCKFLSKIDLKSGYWHMKSEGSSTQKTTNIANESLYEFTSISVGAVNELSTLMRLMHLVLQVLKNTLVHLDDIICFSKTRLEHQRNLEERLERLNQFNLNISQVFREEVKFLGFLIGGHVNRPGPKQNGIQEEMAYNKHWKTASNYVQIKDPEISLFKNKIKEPSTVKRELLCYQDNSSFKEGDNVMART